MKHIAAIAILATFVTSGIARADDLALKATLQARYATLKDAMGARDDKAVSALLAPDFASVDVSGKSEDSAGMLADLDARPKDPNKVSTTTILTTAVSGAIATVSQRYDLKKTKTAADGSTRNIELITVSTDTWTNASGAWLLEKTVTEQVDYYVNGTQIAHRVRTPPSS